MNRLKLLHTAQCGRGASGKEQKHKTENAKEIYDSIGHYSFQELSDIVLSRGKFFSFFFSFLRRHFFLANIAARNYRELSEQPVAVSDNFLQQSAPNNKKMIIVNRL